MDDATPPQDDLVSDREQDKGEPDDESLLDRMRGATVGLQDPNIIGDAGPTDVPPGTDPPAGPSSR